uniref:DUF2637 domain-containing protein n=1 Tax=Streptomyces barkulensis TaxID=1257026 RepID=UPI001F4DBAD6
FGGFAPFFPIGIDAGIVVLLALDLLLTWIRIPFPMLRQTAWLLTAATIAFNGAAAWPDPLGVGMHAVIPVLFVVAVEAARHAVGRIADITADKHMEGVRISRWLLAFPSTFRLWRRMKLWELRSYDQVIRMEQDRLIYEARLRARYGRGWKRRAPVKALMPLRLARYGVPLAETGPAGLAAAGIEPVVFMGNKQASTENQHASAPPRQVRIASQPQAPATPPVHEGTPAAQATRPHSFDNHEQRGEPPKPLTPRPDTTPNNRGVQDGDHQPHSGEQATAPNKTQNFPHSPAPKAQTHRCSAPVPEPYHAEKAVSKPREETGETSNRHKRGNIPKKERDERYRKIQELLRAQPDLTGAEAGRRLQIPNRTASRLVKQAKKQDSATGRGDNATEHSRPMVSEP